MPRFFVPKGYSGRVVGLQKCFRFRPTFSYSPAQLIQGTTFQSKLSCKRERCRSKCFRARSCVWGRIKGKGGGNPSRHSFEEFLLQRHRIQTTPTAMFQQARRRFFCPTAHESKLSLLPRIKPTELTERDSRSFWPYHFSPFPRTGLLCCPRTKPKLRSHAASRAQRGESVSIPRLSRACRANINYGGRSL